jgi:cytosine/adenosine deaminase-related metal-dependent hydrolase
MIIRARTVVPVEGDPIENGAVAVRGNKISAVGRFADVRRNGASDDVLDLAEHILLPGLINTHCHLDYTVLRGKIAPQNSFADWIRAINAEKAKLNGEDYSESMRAGFAEARTFGTTAVANLTAFPQVIGAINEPIRTWWFAELIDVRNPENAEEFANQAVNLLRAKHHWGLAPHAPYTASERLYTRCEEISKREGILLTTHLAESADEMAMFRDAAGPAFDFLKGLGRPMDDCGQETPIARFLRTRRVSERWIVAHLNEADPADFELLARAPKFHVAHCPRSHAFLGHTPFPLERLRALGFNICLGTDSLASNSDLSLFSEMRELLGKVRRLRPADVLQMATVNGAEALGQPGLLGCIRPGAFADLIALPRSSNNVLDEIVAFDGPVPWMMIGGEVQAAA